MAERQGILLQQFLTYRIARLHSKLNNQAGRILDEVSGLSLTQWRILAIIGSTGETTSTDISREHLLDKGLVSRKLKGLVEDGFVISTSLPEDRRVHLLQLSPTGQALYEKTLPRMQTRQRALSASLSEEEERVLRVALDRLEAASDTDAAEP